VFLLTAVAQTERDREREREAPSREVAVPGCQRRRGWVGSVCGDGRIGFDRFDMNEVLNIVDSVRYPAKEIRRHVHVWRIE